MTWERLQKFNVFVLYNLPNEDKGGNWPAEFAPLLELIPRFVNAGGGFFSPGLCVSHGQTMSHELLLNRFEMSAPYERLYETDATRTYTMPTMFRQRFFLTQEIARNHPVTEGVQALWCYFPHDGATLGEFPHPLVPKSPAWQVLVWGSPTARSIRMPNFGEATDEAREPAATYAGKPPLLAVRELGKGRVAVSAMNQSQLIENGWHFAYQGVCLKNGNGTIPSDWEKLLINSYRWLAAPSLAAGTPGGFKPAQSADQRAAAAMQEQIQVGFERTKFGSPAGKHFKGLIGARTALSGGQGTVAEFAAAAQQAGYAWVVFTEAYDQMTEAKWQQLVAECAKATRLTGGADDFWAVAGLEYKDQCGNRFVSYGPNMGWIKPDWLGRKRFGVNEDVAVNFGFPDTILFELAQNKLDPHYIGHYYSVALETYRGPEQKKSVFEFEQYARLQYLRYNLHPTATCSSATC